MPESGVSTKRCFNTALAQRLISSGVTKSRPLIAAFAFAAFIIDIEALGEAPKYKFALVLVLFTIEAIYFIKLSSIKIDFTTFIF